MMDVLFLVGRIAFSLLFLVSAMGHLTQSEQMGGYAESRGVKPGQLLTIVSGLGLLAGGVGVLLGIWIDLAALILAVLMLLFAVLMHPFWRDPAEQRVQEQIQFMKDFALGGGALLLFWATQGTEDLRFSITGALF